MDLVLRVRCNICDQVFCCLDHRRKHEIQVHGFRRKKAVQKVKPNRHIESYALEMRKSFLYLEDTRTTIEKYGRKRKLVNSTKTLVEATKTELQLVERKILVPVSRRKETKTVLPEIKRESLALEDVVSPNQALDNRDMVSELISPVESIPKNDDPVNFVSPGDNNLLDPVNVFTTSTPILEQGRLVHGTNSTPLQSAKKSALRVNRGLNLVKRKVTFHETVDSLYTTAKEETPPVTGNGILSTVAKTFQAAMYTIAGISDNVSDEKAASEWSGSAVKRVRIVPQHPQNMDPQFQGEIKGRRPLYKDRSTTRAVLFH